ncbi:TonB-dependent receptor [Alteriqipengyuania flavescens]|uniref:TonB-dependent receptor n=1 Tax=Alteriqipengyuania flavescens TaxID=3053610 RepID=UPI0025B5858E|nr:TonB-dependent receptor [Alteriqipengyuania flavescens]WJY18236.1 TonB-dependent receptor [Alteriqipengyuania flavescens]WJY24177.1 TonB-dependent receptor [Alteriqipengyuania flavescens]
MKLKYLLATGVAGIGMSFSSAAYAQSTGSVDFEEEDNTIVVTGALETDVGGVEIPDTPKAKQVLDEEIIRRQRPGQTVNDIINLVPGVSFQNNDPWGSSGGGFTIRGFGADRVSQTVDGIPLNDSGNYALYTNQQVDPEVLEQVNVNLGVTDVDSPTASAAGGTVNLRTRVPGDELDAVVTVTFGDVLAEGSGSRPYRRAFGMIDTGDFTGAGTKAFVSGSITKYDNPFNNYGEVEKQQYNARIYQELGGGDFVSIAGHYNQNRNNFFGSFPILALRDLVENFEGEDRFYNINYPCQIPETQLGGSFGAGTPNVADTWSDSSSSGNCGVEFDRRYNPSNTGNIRGSSLITLSDRLTLTIDPSYQYVKANGGGVEDLREGFANRGGVDYTGFVSGGYYYGRDLNNDGDLLDRVAGLDPSQTQTDRYGVVSNLIFDLDDYNRFRVAYTWDRARHRQTGQTTFLFPNGEPYDVFAVNDPLLTSDGFELNKRDRLSYAILHQVSGEYRGEFGDLTTQIGLRVPFFTRELNQNCYTTTASGFVDCLGDQDTTAYEAANPNAVAPVSRTYNYDDVLPNVGLTYAFGDASVFANYAKGLSVPGTDPLYDSLFFGDAESAQPVPETTDSFDAGLRFGSGSLTGQLAGWYTRYNNRLATAYDPVLDEFLFRNLGRVDKYGLDASLAWSPTRNTLLYVFGSLNESEIKEDVQDDAGDFLATAGNRESGTPNYTLGARGQISLGPVELGAQVKYTGERFVNDLNEETIPGYTLVDLDARILLAEYLPGREAAIQINVTNVFDEVFVGYFGGSLDGVPFAQIGAPRAGSISLVFGF